MRKAVFAAVAIVGALLIAFFVRHYTSPLLWGAPTDRSLVESFHTHRQTFETLAHMGTEDASIAWGSTAESLPVARRSEYSELVSQIDTRIWIGFDPSRITFGFAGFGGPISPTWSKGIAYLPAGPSRVGQIVKSLDKDPGHDGVYLAPIEGPWYIIYQRIDYD
jgi:hypothetical protein